MNLLCNALPWGNTSDAYLNIQKMITTQFKSLLWVDSDTIRDERSDININDIYALAVLFWSTSGLQVNGAWMDHFITYYNWQGVICQNNQNGPIIDINL